MAQVNEKDVTAIKDWLAKEPTLPKNFEDILIKKFLYSCNCSLERTKRCIEDFCTSRANMSEIFIKRDPQSTNLKTAFEITNVATYIAGVDELLIHRLNDPDKFDFYDVLKSFMLQADQWLNLDRETLPENHIVILDIGVYTLMMVARANILYFQRFAIFLLEAMPVRLSQVHVINCPSFYEYMYGLVKGALPQQTRDIIHFHTDHMSLHKYINKKYLPSEYGGDAGSMVEQSLGWIKDINENRKFFLNDDLWKADVSKKVKNGKNGAVEATMSGSFRTLAID